MSVYVVVIAVIVVDRPERVITIDVISVEGKRGYLIFVRACARVSFCVCLCVFLSVSGLV